MFKKSLFLVLFICLFFFLFINSNVIQTTVCVRAENVITNQSNEVVLNNENNNIYVVYSVDGKYLFEKQNVMLDDEYIDKELRTYRIVEVDEKTKTAKAKFVEKYDLPKVAKREDVPVSAVANSRGNIGIYMTHNDESYVSGDGYDSVYGKGGIHDIALAFSLSLNSKRISTIFSENLHIPHDSSAYSRSNVTAKSLINNYGADAIFDIHRDGTSRGFYVTKVNGEERCMVRMVVGKSSPNYAKNKAFALFLMSVAKEYAPWLFVDIYLGSGHYNQGVSEYAMLFEMGCHLVEKDLVLQTVPYLAEVVSIALYGELEIVPDDKEENNSSNSTDVENEIEDDNENNMLPNGESSNQDSIENKNPNNITNQNANKENQIGGIVNNNGNEPLDQFMQRDEDNLVQENQNNLLKDNQNNFNSPNGQGFLALFIVICIITTIYLVIKIRNKRNKKNI